MGKNAINDEMQMVAVGKNSQIARLKKIAKETKVSLVIGIVLLILFFLSMVNFAVESGHQIDCTMYLNQYRLGSKALTSAVRCYAVTGNKMYYDAYMQELEVDKNRDIAWAGLEANNLTAKEWDTLNEIASLSNGLVPLEENAMASVTAGDLKSAADFVFGKEYNDTAATISSLTDDLITQVQDRLKGRKNAMLILQTLCAALFLFSFIKMARQCTKTVGFANKELLHPIVKVSDQMKVLASGNLHTDLNLAADDSEVGRMVDDITTMKDILVGIIEEIGFALEQMGQGNYKVSIEREYVGEYIQIEQSLKKIIEEMRVAIGDISTATQEIDSGAGQLAQAATDLADSCTSQACQVSDMVSQITQLRESISYNEKEAEEAVKISNLASSTLVAAGEKMSELDTAMNEINECSRQINVVTSSISELADEIEMLSLNASIESARAGEAGRGFAVVAEQVKKLAEASLEAAGQTSELIERTTQAVDAGMRIAKESAECMEDVQMGAEETASRINGIVEKLKSEVDSIVHINDGINVIAGLVDNNSATSQETAAIGEELKSQVDSMVDLMGRFRI
ncbi:methyl-accepting chemotaxis protein [Lachnospiraceae bacterium MD335]|jgi:methyl-accepting chemotaxis protein|nr:methyl-accepting chemotaxis protein [Lachnospiraceae bacterium MD335]